MATKTIVIEKGERIITKIKSESLPMYFRDISGITGKSKNIYKLLDKDEEIALAKKIKAGDKNALNRMVCANLRFVISVAKKYQNHGVPLDDLINEGNMGLMEAAKTFDETRGVRFISWAVYYIRQAILLALSEQSKIVHIPLNKYNINFKIKKLQEQHRVKNGEDFELSKDKIAQELNINLEQLEDALEAPSGMGVSISSTISPDDDKSTLEDVIPQQNTPSPDANLDYESLLFEINKTLRRVLDEREIQVIKLFYGIEQDRPRSLQEIADLIIDPATGNHFTKESIRQTKEKAIRRLRIMDLANLKIFY